MSDYWQSTKSPVHLFARAYESEAIAKHVAENSFIDAAALADELRIRHLNTWAVEAYQRRLGVRRIASWKDRK
jgi:hypothetical protein